MTNIMQDINRWGLTIQGLVLEVAERAGGEGDQAWASTHVRILAGSEVVPIRWDRTQLGLPPTPSTVANIRVVARAYTKRNGEAGLSYSALPNPTITVKGE